MTTTANIGWGKYGGYEGPLFWGSAGVTVAEEPSDAEKVLKVVTSTEGGKWDAINMYDRMIISVGAIQWGEASQFSVSDMLGKVSQKSPALLAPLQPAFDQAQATFRQNAAGRHRFFQNGTEVVTLTQQQALFLKGSTGKLGTWDDESKAYARVWAASMANVFQQADAQKAQADFTVPRLRSFALKEAQAILWGEDFALPNDSWVGALRAAYLSFAANLPAVANTQIQKAPLDGLAKWTPNWCIAILKQLTFGPGIAIYPHRYESIRPVVEQLYGVNLPDFAPDLQAWQAEYGIDPTSPTPTFTTTKEIQTELLAEGYDLGPAGADGREGPKTRDAVRSFQQKHGLNADGIVGKNTRKALVAEYSARG